MSHTPFDQLAYMVQFTERCIKASPTWYMHNTPNSTILGVNNPNHLYENTAVSSHGESFYNGN